MDNDMKRMS